MNLTILKYLAAAVAGAWIGGCAAYGWEHTMLLTEQNAHAQDLKAVSDAAATAQQKSIEDHAAAAQQIAALDTQLTKEKQSHEKDNAANRAAIADGTRQLRIAVAGYTGSSDDSQGPSPGSLGYAATGYAVLAPEAGLALYAIADGADAERGQLIYLQGYVRTLQQRGYVEGISAGLGMAP